LSHLTEQYSDANLLDLYKKNKDTKWLGFLFERYALLVFGVCMKYLKQVNDAQDATQQVFEKAFSEIQKYEVVYFKSWIYSIAKNHCLMQLRGKEHALQEISHDQKICIELFYFQKLSYKEIEQKTGYSFQQVKSHIQNGKRNLRIILEQKQKAPGHE